MCYKIITFCKIFCVLFVILFVLTACGSEQNNTDIPDSTQEVETVIPEQETQKPVEDEITEPPQTVEKTAVQQAYEDMLNGTEFLSLTNTGYTFKGYVISKENVVKIGDNLVINQGAMYEEIGAGIDLYCEFGLSQLLDDVFFSVLLDADGEPEDWDELSQELYGFITADGTDKEILSKLETLSTVSGSFDYEDRNYSFEIADLEKTAEELHISQEMLGYVLAKLNEYTDNLVFEGNKLICSFEVKTYS